MRDAFVAVMTVLNVLVGLLLLIVPPIVLLLATFVWGGKWIARAWLPVPVIIAAFWALGRFGSSAADVDALAAGGGLLIGAAAVLYYKRLHSSYYREQRQPAPAAP